MEIVAMDMKLRGMYIARQLSFHGVSFKIEEVPLSKEFEKIYDQSVILVSVIWFCAHLNYKISDHLELIKIFYSGSKQCKNLQRPPSL